MKRLYYLTGGYTEEDLVPGSRGKGIQLWEFDGEEGRLEPVATFRGVSNPSWVTSAGDGRLLAAASEHTEGRSRMVLLHLRKTGRMEILDTLPSGDATCHVAFSPEKDVLAGAGYVSGEAVFAGLSNGRFKGTPAVTPFAGEGPDRKRQESSHPHQIVFSDDGSLCLIPDLGADRVQVLKLREGNPVPAGSCEVPSGEGPRHLARSRDGKFLYLLAELTGRVHVLAAEGGRGMWRHLAGTDSLPMERRGSASGAAIRTHPRLPLLYVSDRNTGSVAVMELRDGGREVAFRSFHPFPGTCPRDFAVTPDGRWLLLGGQESGRLHVHPLDPEDGRPGPVHSEQSCPSVSCIHLL